ncbi:hypothetical protein BDZ89DRAFT_1019443 [Hymenopellis radicata]|nr:hypothetical protein BDZ89DRAFT_1019443 [Hymenopellis radicata]
MSSETTSRASWFAPWSWYPSPTTASIDGTVQDPSPDPPTDGMTPSERIREEALARPDPTIEEMQASASNAILESTVANRSGWTSFFMSVNRKAIETGTDVKRDENGNEIMDIDEDDDSASVEPKPEPKKLPAPQLTISEDVKKEASSKRKVSAPPPPKPPASPKPSIASKKEKKDKQPAPPPPPPVPNYVLPTWEDIFHTQPRAQPPPPPTSSRLLRFITGKGKSREDDLPCMLQGDEAGWAKSCKRVVVLGIHGWFPGAIMRTMFGEPTGTSPKFVSMMEQALENFQTRHGFRFEKVTGMPLEGEGTIGGRVEKLYNALMGNESWVSDLHDADAILVATHSQGSVVSTHLLNRLIEEGHIVTALSVRAMPDELIGLRRVQRVCCLALCGIHLGPLRYLSSSSLLQPYFQYLETQAARELFEFQNTNSEVSKAYVSALRNVVHHGTKMVYIASLNDQVVPMYSGLFTSASHPLILRALYMDGDAFHSSDFLSNLLVLLIRILNSDLSDSGLISLLSEATAGSLNGVGHSTAYEEIGTYSLAVDYLFRTTPGPLGAPLHMEDFDAAQEQNDYEIPWALRDLIADERVRHLVGSEIGVLRGMFGNWKPRTAILRDVKKKLGPIQRLGNIEGRRSPSKL